MGVTALIESSWQCCAELYLNYCTELLDLMPSAAGRSVSGGWGSGSPSAGEAHDVLVVGEVGDRAHPRVSETAGMLDDPADPVPHASSPGRTEKTRVARRGGGQNRNPLPL